MLWGSLYGVSQAIGVYWFYAAVSAGPIAVVSPLAAVLNAAVPVAVGVALGERPGETASAGVVLAIVAVIWSAASRRMTRMSGRTNSPARSRG